MHKVVAEGRVKLVADLVRAVIAGRRVVCAEVARAAGGKEVGHVLAARLAGRRGERVELGRRALDLAAVELGDDHAADEARERVQLVQPRAPEARDLRLGNRDAAEEREDDDDEGVAEGGRDGRGRHGGDELAQRHAENLRDEHHEELVAGSRRCRLEARDVVDGQEEADGAQHRVRHLGQDHADAKGERLVRFGRLLAEGDHARNGVLGLDLRQDERRQDRYLENYEDAVLQRCSGVVELQEKETRADGDHGVRVEAGEAVIGSAPEGQLSAATDSLDLVPKRRRILLLMDLGGSSNFRDAFFFHADNVLLDLFEFLRLFPNVGPIPVANAGSLTSTNGIQHPLGRVQVRRAVGATASKVVDEGRGVLANVTKVDTLAATLEEKQAVELLEEGRAGLVNRAKNGLASGCQLLEEANNVPRALAVQTTGRLVQEEQQFRLGRKLDADGDTLALFDGETSLCFSNDGVGNVFHFQERDDFLDVGVLFGLGSLIGLAEIG